MKNSIFILEYKWFYIFYNPNCRFKTIKKPCGCPNSGTRVAMTGMGFGRECSAGMLDTPGKFSDSSLVDSLSSIITG